jgi:hypothetical protein
MNEETAIPSEALERLMSVLVWGWMNSDTPEASLEHIADRALRAVIGYIDEHCPEWYGRQWLRQEEMAAISQSLHTTLQAGDATPVPAMDSVTWLDGMSARDKLVRALAAS